MLTLLADMIASKTLTDDRLAAFFMISRRVLNLSGCCSIRNSILRQIPFRCPELVRGLTLFCIASGQWLQATVCAHPVIVRWYASAAWISPTALK